MSVMLGYMSVSKSTLFSDDHHGRFETWDSEIMRTVFSVPEHTLSVFSKFDVCTGNKIGRYDHLQG